MNDLKSEKVTEIKVGHDKIMDCVKAFDTRRKVDDGRTRIGPNS